VGAIAFIFSLWLRRNDNVFNDKNYSTLQVIPGYQYYSFMVLSSEGGGSRPLYEGLCMFEGYSEEYFFPT
jgi:hypothetical protein